MLADELDFVIGVDTHRDAHSLALVQARRAGLSQLRALVVSCPEPLRAGLRGLSEARLLERYLTLGSRPGSAERHGTLVALAAASGRVRCLSAEAREVKREIEALVRALAPALLAEPGVGPISAAQLLISWSHRGASTAKPPSPTSPQPRRSPPPQDRSSATASTAAAIAS